MNKISSKNFYIADTHFDHYNIINFDKRPFYNAQEMNEYMIYSWNKQVADNDTVHILGDFCFGNEARWIEILSQLRGSKVLVRGNHDFKRMSAELISMFVEVCDYKEISDSGYQVIMSHYPMLAYKSAYNPNYIMLHGHTHITMEQQLVEKWTNELLCSGNGSFANIFNVGCMMPYMHYAPQTIEHILGRK